MKTSIRRNVFETNSSSTHSITICSKQEFEDWKNGKLVYDSYGEKLFSKNDVVNKDDYEDFMTYDNFEDQEIATYVRNYKTKNGDEIVVFGSYGSDY